MPVDREDHYPAVIQYAVKCVEEIWHILEDGLKEIFYKGNPLTRQQYIMLYTTIYNCCTRTDPDITGMQGRHEILKAKATCREIYARLKDFLKKYLINLVQTSFLDIDDEIAVKKYMREWKLYSANSAILNGLFTYINRHWIKSEAQEHFHNVYQIKHLAIVVWKEYVFKKLHERLNNYIFKQIAKDRNGERVDHKFLRDILNCYENLGYCEDLNMSAKSHQLKVMMYYSYFEMQFLKKTADYYENECSKYMKKHGPMKYIAYAEKRLAEERKRVNSDPVDPNSNSYLDESSLSALMGLCDIIFIKTYLQQFRKKFSELFDEKNFTDMQRIFVFLESDPKNLTDIGEVLTERITEEGRQAIKECYQVDTKVFPVTFVKTILNVYFRYKKMITKMFNGNYVLLSALDKGCENFINSNVITTTHGDKKSAEYVAKYFHILFKKISNNVEVKDLNKKLERAMIVCNYLYDKDAFQYFYAALMVPRLILHSMKCDPYEEFVIKKFEESCGYYYTIKLQRMVNDIRSTDDLNNNFRQYLETENVTIHTEFTVKVLSCAVWPYTKNSSVTIPSTLGDIMKHFRDFYQTKHECRKLTWLNEVCCGDIMTSCFDQNYIIRANTFQVAVLLQFNKKDKWNVKALIKNTQMEESVILIVLQDLLNAELFICENDAEQPLTIDSVIRLNQNYTNQNLEINLNKHTLLGHSYRKVDTRSLYGDIEENQKLIIQAAIVRIMKLKRVLGHNELVEEVKNSLVSQFRPTPSAIRQCIELLITRSFIEPYKSAFYKYIP